MKVSHKVVARRRRIIRTDRAETGSALLVSLVFVLVFSVILSAILTFATTNATSSTQTIARRNRSYAADGAIDAAINWVKTTPNVGRDQVLYPTDPACVYQKPAVTSGPNPTPAITVTCAAEDDSGSGRGPDGGTYPVQAVLTLGKRSTLDLAVANHNYPGCDAKAEQGVAAAPYELPGASDTCDTSKAKVGAPWTVRGDVRSASTVKIDGIGLQMYPFQNGTTTKATVPGLKAEDCTGSVQSRSATSASLTNSCTGNTPATPDPNYTYRTLPSNIGVVPATCSAGVTTIDPGTFTNAAALSDLFASPTCKDKYVWFKPGVYYFNFNDTADQPMRCGNPASSDYIAEPDANRHEWCIGRNNSVLQPNVADNNVHVVGGTPFNWDGVTPPAAGKEFPQNITGDNPYGGNCDPGKPGVQFVFGGDSRVYVADGTFELCAGPVPGDPDAPRIAIYGLKQQPAFVVTATPGGTTCPSRSNGRCTENVAGSQKIGDGEVTTLRYNDSCNLFCFDHVRSDPVTVGFAGYTMPAGNQIEKVVMRAAYNTKASNAFCNTDNFGNKVLKFFGQDEAFCTRPEFTVNNADGPGACTDSKKLPATTVMRVYNLDITDCFNPNGNALAGLSINWYARAKCPGTCPSYNDELDGLEITVTLKSTVPNAVRPADGCITNTPNYQNGLGNYDCAVLKSDQLGASTTDPGVAGQWVGRTSIKGTIYAPSAAVDFSDAFAKYPLFQRGLIARHLHIGSYSYIGSLVNSPSCGPTAVCEPTAHVADIDPRPFVFPREITFTACVQATTGDQDVCDAAEGDTILSTATTIYHVTADADPAAAGAQPAADRPEILSWTSAR